MISIEDKIHARIKRHKRGWAMTNRDFIDLATAATVDWSKKCDWIYTYTPKSKMKTVEKILSTIDWPSEQRKSKIISTKTKLIKAQTGKQN